MGHWQITKFFEPYDETNGKEYIKFEILQKLISSILNLILSSLPMSSLSINYSVKGMINFRENESSRNIMSMNVTEGCL